MTKSLQKPTSIDPTVIKMISAFIRESERSATLVIGLIHAWGLQDLNFSKSTLLKLAAFMRLKRWELAGFSPLLPPSLPSSDEVFQDMLVGDLSKQRFSGEELDRQTFVYWFTHMSWEFLSPVSDIVISNSSQSDLTETLANFLWKHRNATQKGN